MPRVDVSGVEVSRTSPKAAFGVGCAAGGHVLLSWADKACGRGARVKLGCGVGQKDTDITWACVDVRDLFGAGAGLRGPIVGAWAWGRQSQIVGAWGDCLENAFGTVGKGVVGWRPLLVWG